MRDTIEHYLRKYGNLSMKDCPMNEVDSLILCQMVYWRLDKFVPSVMEHKPFVPLAEIVREANQDAVLKGILFERYNRKLFARLRKAKRFRAIKLNWFLNRIDPCREMQFAAVTYLMEDGSVYIAFRGTDETFVGWKEDLHMALPGPIPGQHLSVKYLNVVAKRFGTSFCVGGHSKGGNLAVYSAMQCKPEIQARIRKIYNLDGPGLHPDMINKERYALIANRIEKVLPAACLVGMLFERGNHYHVIASRAWGIVQHNPFHWKIRDNHFVRVKALHKGASRRDQSINRWILSLDDLQVQKYVNRIFRILMATGCDNFLDIKLGTVIWAIIKSMGRYGFVWLFKRERIGN